MNEFKTWTGRFFEFADTDESRATNWISELEVCGAPEVTRDLIEDFKSSNFEHLTTTAETVSLMLIQGEELFNTYLKWSNSGEALIEGAFDPLSDNASQYEELIVLFTENQLAALAPLIESN
jgi:hypothetical protein